MNPRTTATLGRLFWGPVATAALSACGGQGDSGAESSQDYRFKTQAQVQSDWQAAGTTPSELSLDERADVQKRSREWGTTSLLSPRLNTVNGPVLLPGNGATIPALHFGRAFTLQAAAQGDTLAALVAATPAPSSAAVAAALQGGLQRTVSAGENTLLTPGFIDAVTARRWPGTFGSLKLQPLTDTQLQARAVQLNHQLRASVEDRAAGLRPWPQVTPFRAAWQSGVDWQGSLALPVGAAIPDRSWSNIAMLRIQAPTRAFSSAGWQGQAMVLSGGYWLLKIEPADSLVPWTPAQLNAALASAATTLLESPAVAPVSASWELPEMSFRGSNEMNDFGGMAMAMNERNANLRGLDGGGTFARLFAATASSSAAEVSVSLTGEGLGYSGTQGVDFIFSPLNIHGSNFTSGSAFTNSTFFVASPTSCPTTTVVLRPFFLALLQANGNLALLTRLNSFSSSPCVKL